ncbi:MAG: hypothetical protein ABI551_26230 [Polyangiaceae bacterium]
MNEQERSAVEAKTKRTRGWIQWVAGCLILVPLVFFAAAMSLVTVLFGVDMLRGELPVPRSLGGSLAVFVMLLLLALFLVFVARRSIAGFLGKPDRYQFPRIAKMPGDVAVADLTLDEILGLQGWTSADIVENRAGQRQSVRVYSFRNDIVAIEPAT